jgi:hypothetical protein
MKLAIAVAVFVLLLPTGGRTDAAAIPDVFYRVALALIWQGDSLAAGAPPEDVLPLLDHAIYKLELTRDTLRARECGR